MRACVHTEKSNSIEQSHSSELYVEEITVIEQITRL